MAGLVFGTGLLVVCLVAWWSFDPEVRARFTTFQRGTLAFLGLLIYGAGYALGRSRVVAHPDGLVVVNGYRRREYTWPEVVAVHLPPGAPWAVLDLADGTSQAAMGIQGSDGPRARQAVRELRQLIDRQPG
jgi:hypothetical protein